MEQTWSSSDDFILKADQQENCGHLYLSLKLLQRGEAPQHTSPPPVSLPPPPHRQHDFEKTAKEAGSARREQSTRLKV